MTDEKTRGGAGGAGIANSGTIGTLINSGTISGGAGGAGGSGKGGTGGVGISGPIELFINDGTIEGGAGGQGSPDGAAGDAIAPWFLVGGGYPDVCALWGRRGIVTPRAAPRKRRTALRVALVSARKGEPQMAPAVFG